MRMIHNLLIGLLQSLINFLDKKEIEKGEPIDPSDVQIEFDSSKEPIPIVSPDPNEEFTWIVAAGHTAATKGKESPILPDGSKLEEYDWNRRVIEAMVPLMKERGIQYVIPNGDWTGNSFSRESIDGGDDRDDIYRRVNLDKKLNREGKKVFFVDIHANAAPGGRNGWTSAEGTEVWYWKNSIVGAKLASIFLNNIVAKTGWTKRTGFQRGYKTEGIPAGYDEGTNFYVLRETASPAIIVEYNFFNNYDMVKELLTNETVTKVAEATVDAMEEANLSLS